MDSGGVDREKCLARDSQVIKDKLINKNRCSKKEWDVFEKVLSNLTDTLAGCEKTFDKREVKHLEEVEENLAVAATRLKHLTPEREKKRKVAHLERKLAHHHKQMSALKVEARQKGSVSRTEIIKKVDHERRKIRSILKLINALKK
ncbi:MAG: hypothetical protein P0S94_05360 [Simkaniaceae bacterium]|nr:hypothetical protein [Simkaniaceae bacterium]